MNKTATAFAFFFLLFSISFCFAKDTLIFNSVPMAEGILLMAKDSNFILLDVRRPDEYASGHIPGAIILTNETITKEKAETFLQDKSQHIYVYCRSGRRSKESSRKLVEYGYTNVIEIGGIIDYTGKIEK